MLVQVNRDNSGTSGLDELINRLTAKYSNVEKLQLDGKDGRLLTGTGGGYIALYSPHSGWMAVISSDLPKMETSDFLESLRIEPL